MFIAFLCATAAVAGAANIAIVDDVLEFDTPIGGAVVKGALHVGGEITVGTEKVKVIATLAKCTADSENNAEAIQDRVTTLQLDSRLGEYDATLAAYDAKLAAYEATLAAYESTASNTVTEMAELKTLVNNLVKKNSDLAAQVGPPTTTSTRTTQTTQTTVTTTTVTTTTKCSDHKLTFAPEEGWHHVFELEDDRSKNDMPDSYDELSKPYKNQNAFFIGHENLANLPSIKEAELCHGPTTTSDKGKLACIPISQKYVGKGIVDGRFAGSEAIGALANGIPEDQMRIKQMLACFAGTCLGNAYAAGAFWETGDTKLDLCATDSIGTWTSPRPGWARNGESKVWCKGSRNGGPGTYKTWGVPTNVGQWTTVIGTQGNGDYANKGNQGFHVWSNGITLYVPGSSFDGNHEFDETNDERVDGTNNRLVLRVKFKDDQCIDPGFA